MPRGVYDRGKARRNRSKTLSARIDALTKELASISEEVRQTEGLKAVVDEYMGYRKPTGRGAGGTTARTPRGRRATGRRTATKKTVRRGRRTAKKTATAQ